MRNRKCILAAVLALGLTFQAVPVSAEETVETIDETVQAAEETTQSTEETAQQEEDTAQTEEETTEITIYHTNDTHGYLQGDGESVIGLPLVAGLKNADENAILVDAGDATQGLPLASLTQGNDVIQLMNLAGYDVMAAGNHEFDFGTDAFLKNVSLAKFPVLAANIYKDNQLLLAGQQDDTDGCHVIIERQGKKIGFFGLTTTETASATNPEGIQGVTFADEIETAKTEIAHLEEAGADVVIAVAHMGDETGGADCTSEDLANGMTGEYQGKLDAIIDGHSHTVENEEVNDVQIVQTGTGLSAVGKLTVSVSENSDPVVTEELLGIEDFAEVTPDAEVAAELEKITSEQNDSLQEVIGSTPTTLWAGWIGNVPPTRFVETNYGDLAADAIAGAAKAMVQQNGTEEEKQMPVVGVENGGGIREMIPNGDITKGDLVSTFPFSNTIYMKKITPKILYEVMEQSGSSLDGQDPETGMLLQQSVSGGFLQISGFQVVFNPDAGQGSRVVSITLDGQSTPLDRTDDTTQIIMAGNNYIMSGGNDYTMLADLPKYAEAGGELETIEAYAENSLNNGTLSGYQGTKGRIAYTGSVYQPKDYTASVKIVNEDGSVFANQEISYRVDGGEGQMGRTDENGILHITVTDGGHGIRVSDSQDEVYVDNYAGLGIVEDALRTMPQLTAPEAGSEIPVNSTEEPKDPEDPEDPSKDEETTDPGKDTGTGSGGSENDKKDPGASGGTTNTGNTTKTDNGADGQKKAVKTGDEAPVEAAGTAAIVSLAVIAAVLGTKVRRK